MFPITPLDLIACHMVGDYIFQTDYMAKHKMTHPGVLFLHVLTYSMPFAALLLIAGVPLATCGRFIDALAGLHWLTDMRRWVSAKGWCAKPILVDQTLHIVQLAVLWHVFLAP